MYVCIICRDRDLPLDNMAHTHPVLARGICERCWLRETGHTEHVTKEFRREIEEAMTA